MTDRLFFALWPDERLRRELARRLLALVEGADVRVQRPDQWHVTLEFLGGVTSERQPAVWAAADRVVVAPFAVDLDVLEYWRKPQVLCLAATRTPPLLAQLVAGLRAALAAEGFVPESREYRPHVTLARKARAARSGTLAEPVRWRADRYALVRSVTDPAGSRYEPLRWWNLPGRDG